MAIRWKDVEITDKNDNVLRGVKAQQFVQNNCPGAIENITKTKSLADVVRVKLPDGKTSLALDDIRRVLSSSLANIAKSLTISEGKLRHRVDFPVARAVPNRINVVPALLQMYLDVDRDGNVDNAPANHNDWTWDVGGHGAVITVKTREYTPNAAVSERQPIEFRWGPGARPPNWQATLTANHPNRIRVYRQQAEGATLIPLPWDFSNVGAEDAAGLYRIWIEAVDYPLTLPEADWLVQLDFSLSFNGAERNRQTAVVRIAPWIMVSDLDKTQKLYIVDFGVSDNIKNGIIKINNTTVRNEVAQSCLGVTTFVPVTQGLQGLGRYLRDAMRFGTHVAPAQNQPVITPVVLRSNNQGTQHNVPLNGIDRVNDGIGYIAQGGFVPSDLQTGGNMMVSPPVAGYPWGRIICGSGAIKGGLGTWENFLKAQRVQRPILLDTDWLSVGHSDEIIAFVPKVIGSGAGGRNFRMLVTSPRLGYQLLEQAAINWNAVELAHTNHEALYSQYQNNFYAHNFPPSVDMRDYIPNNLDYAGDTGEGRMGFRRFGNDKRPLHVWLDEFLANDELITRIQGGDAVLRVAHLAELQIWFNNIPPAPNSYAYKQIRDAVNNYQNNGFASLTQTLKDTLRLRLLAEINRLRQLAGARTDPETRRLGLFLLCDHPTVRNLRESKELLTSIADPVALQFPTPANYLAACTQIWNLAQPVIDQLVLNAPLNTHLPSTDTIYVALQNEFALHGIDALTWTTLRSTLRDNLILQAKIATIVKTINTELNLNPADIIDVPILYTAFSAAKTHVADMVNFVMLNTPGATVDAEAASCTCIIPKPFGPIVNGVDIYENYFHQQLQALGITVSFLDEWYEYHLNDGEIHCGTNQLPDITVAASQKKWWTKQSPP
jgi:Protein-arginine deiminase (PAD)